VLLGLYASNYATIDHLARVDTGAIDGAAEQHLEGQHPVAGIEEQAAEHFVGLVSQLGLEVIPHRPGVLQCRIPPQSLGQVPTGHFQHRLQLGELGRPETRPLAERGQVRLQQRAQPAELDQELAREVHGALPRQPGAQENGEEFGVGKGRRALFE